MAEELNRIHDWVEAWSGLRGDEVGPTYQRQILWRLPDTLFDRVLRVAPSLGLTRETINTVIRQQLNGIPVRTPFFPDIWEYGRPT